VVNFDFSHQKLKKQAFFGENFKIQGGPFHFRHPWKQWEWGLISGLAYGPASAKSGPGSVLY